MSSFKNLFFFLLLLLLLSSSLSLFLFCNSSPVGFTISRDRPGRRPSVPTVQSVGITKVRLTQHRLSLVRPLTLSGSSFLVNVPNPMVPELSLNRSRAVYWLFTHVVPFHPRVPITVISIGNDLLSDSLFPAIRSIHLALQELRFRNLLPSTSSSFHLIKNPFPPSAPKFQEPISELILRPLLDFLSVTNSSFLINGRPYDDHFLLNKDIPIGFVLFQEQPFVFLDDPATGVRYRNIFDVMIDALVAAMEGLGHKGMAMIVTETDWMSRGFRYVPAANPKYAEMYNVGVVRHLKSPLRRGGVSERYDFELVDEGMKEEAGYKRLWGILNMNISEKNDNEYSPVSNRVKGGGSGAGLMVLVVTFFAVVVGVRMAYR